MLSRASPAPVAFHCGLFGRLRLPRQRYLGGKFREPHQLTRLGLTAFPAAGKPLLSLDREQSPPGAGEGLRRLYFPFPIRARGHNAKTNRLDPVRRNLPRSLYESSSGGLSEVAF